MTMQWLLTAMLLLASTGAAGGAAAGAPRSPQSHLERSYWLHASLGSSMVRGYWAVEAPAKSAPGAEEVRAAARLLMDHYGANRLYLIYHKEVPVTTFGRLIRIWRAACPREVSIVPTLVLRMYDPAASEVFSGDEIRQVCRELRSQVGVEEIAVYDVMPNRDQGTALRVLRDQLDKPLVRVGVQPDEEISAPYHAAVQDTWSGLCAGKTDTLWRSPGSGAESLRKWVQKRNRQSKRVAWDLVAVAWDYDATATGEYPGYDDSARNMPLPRGRNSAAVRLILDTAESRALRGFSSDLLIVESNARDANRDGESRALYASLRKGVPYNGYFAAPLEEIASIYRNLRQSTWTDWPAMPTPASNGAISQSSAR